MKYSFQDFLNNIFELKYPNYTLKRDNNCLPDREISIILDIGII